MRRATVLCPEVTKSGTKGRAGQDHRERTGPELFR